VLYSYRNSVVDDEFGDELSDIVRNLARNKKFTLGGTFYKRIPSGYDASHPNCNLLLHNGLYVGFTGKIPDELYSGEIIPYCMNIFSQMAPLHNWLVALGERTI
jgi:hypothetical protein